MLSDTNFPGQQEDERILYVIRPHMTAPVIVLLKILAAVFVFTLCIWFLPKLSVVMDMQRQVQIILGIILTGVLYAWYRFSSSTISYITDRRLIRFDSRPPLSKRRRALFWTEVAKAKAFSENSFLRLLKVGSIELRAKVNSEENVIVENVYYFDDLVNYIDKLLHLTHANPLELKEVKPFVLKPTGQRY